MFGKTRESLNETLVGTVLLDHACPLGGRWEQHPHGEPGLAADVLEGDPHLEPHRLDTLASAVAVDQQFRLHDLVIGDAILIIASIGSMHDEPPHAARTRVEDAGGRGEAVWSPPLRQMFG